MENKELLEKVALLIASSKKDDEDEELLLEDNCFKPKYGPGRADCTSICSGCKKEYKTKKYKLNGRKEHFCCKDCFELSLIKRGRERLSKYRDKTEAYWDKKNKVIDDAFEHIKILPSDPKELYKIFMSLKYVYTTDFLKKFMILLLENYEENGRTLGVLRMKSMFSDMEGQLIESLKPDKLYKAKKVLGDAGFLLNKKIFLHRSNFVKLNKVFNDKVVRDGFIELLK